MLHCSLFFFCLSNDYIRIISTRRKLVCMYNFIFNVLRSPYATYIFSENGKLVFPNINYNNFIFNISVLHNRNFSRHDLYVAHK